MVKQITQCTRNVQHAKKIIMLKIIKMGIINVMVCMHNFCYKFLTFVTDSLDQRIKNAYFIRNLVLVSWESPVHTFDVSFLFFFP